jgi:hypothetical protein
MVDSKSKPALFHLAVDVLLNKFDLKEFNTDRDNVMTREQQARFIIMKQFPVARVILERACNPDGSSLDDFVNHVMGLYNFADEDMKRVILSLEDGFNEIEVNARSVRLNNVLS